MFYVDLKRIYILLLLNRIFHKCKINLIYIVQVNNCLIDSLIYPCLSLLKPPTIILLTVYPFNFCYYFLYVLCALIKHFHLLNLLDVYRPLYHSVIIFHFFLRVFWLSFAWTIFPSLHSWVKCIFKASMSLLCSQNIIGSCF